MKTVLKTIKKHKILLIILALLSLVCVYIYSPDKNFPSDTGEYRPIVLGETIDFTQDGNSDLYVSKNLGWGAQESLYRCTVEPDIYMKLYINNDDQAVELNVLAAGSFPEPHQSQEVKVYANEILVATWIVSEKQWHTTTIPAKLIKDNQLDIHFKITHPFTPDGDIRKLGMIVSEIKLNKIYGLETKKQIKNWLYKHIKKVIGELTPEEKQALTEPAQPTQAN